MKTQATKTLISEYETAEFGGCKRKTTVYYDHLTNEEVTTNLVEDKGRWVTESVSKANDVSWTTNTASTFVTGDTTDYTGYTTTPNTTGGSYYASSIHIGSVDSELEKLLPLVELIGSCVACGDDADVLLCPPCGVAVRELGRSRLQEYMREIQEELG